MSPRSKMLMSLVAGATVIFGDIPVAAQDGSGNLAAGSATTYPETQWLADFAAINRLDEQADLAA
ncbi:hypothetical protein, partial [Sphingopyxis sp. BSNA05]|uniref:hypothetical protein n=1 Tax=Sphingopyxis sp. BSNA05 TaxID=1236614 RepID=UPI001563D8D5